MDKKVQDFLKIYADDSGLPIIPTKDWVEFRSDYDKKYLKNEYAEYLIGNNVPFPYKKYNAENLQTAFTKLYNYNYDWTFPKLIDEKYTFKYTYIEKPLGVVGSSSNFNILSDNYQQKNRLNASSIYFESPLECWSTQKELSRKLSILWGDAFLDTDGIIGATYLKMFRLFHYTCSQFKPSVAKSIYVKAEARYILDLSCGWGDRLAGFYTTPNTKEYIGCDPNSNVYKVYKQQCLDYEKFLGHNAELKEFDNYFECKGSKFVRIYNLPAEDVDWNQYKDHFDIMFTSPPYFDLEIYDNGNENQSSSRYPGFQNWKDKFFFPLIEMTIPTIKQNGYYMVNITEPKKEQWGIDNYSLCDEMVEFITNLSDMFYVGKIGMLLKTRPTKTEKSDAKTIEPIWCFRKGIDEAFKVNSVEDFF